jgi:hypothetical protein
MLRWTWLCIGIALGQATPASCGEKPQSPTAEEIKALVDQLVSPNPTPDEKKLNADPKGDPVFPRGYDFQKQKPVNRACGKLGELGPRAFPFLIEHWEDNRYCLTYEGAEWSNMFVGGVCRDLIRAQLQPYVHHAEKRHEKGHLPPSYVWTFLASQKAARQWWEGHKAQTLLQMQLEVLDWAIAEEAKRRNEFTGAERRELHDLRKELVKGGKALPPKGVPHGTE